jgi:hypothetical protein
MILQRSLLSFPLAALLAIGAAGCLADAKYYYGEDAGATTLTLADPDEGIYPSLAALSDPSNPYASSNLGADTKWNVQSKGGPVQAFYVWATVNARGPSGESQFYVALNLKAVFEASAAPKEALPAIHDQAIRAYQAVLDYFPDGVTFDATGKIPYELATPSYQAIVALGGKVQNNWVLVQTADGQSKAVKQ